MGTTGNKQADDLAKACRNMGIASFFFGVILFPYSRYVCAMYTRNNTEAIVKNQEQVLYAESYPLQSGQQELHQVYYGILTIQNNMKGCGLYPQPFYVI